MFDRNASNTFTLKFLGLHPTQHKIPVLELTNALNGLQRTVYLIAMEYEGIDTRTRDRISRDIEQKYPVLCHPLQEGSVVVDVVVGDEESDLFARQSFVAVSDILTECIRSVVEVDRIQLARLIKDKVRRSRVIDSIRWMIPKRGRGIDLEFLDCNKKCLFHSNAMSNSISEFLPSSKNEESIQIVTGRFSKIDFDSRTITLIYPPTRKELKCYYDESIEDKLLQHPREYIQVTGQVIVDQDGYPKTITDVESIQELDLSPLILSEFTYEGQLHKLKKPILLEPSQDESKQLLCLNYEGLGIDIFAFTRDELGKELINHMEFLWKVYALGDQSQMTPGAVTLALKLREMIQEERMNV